MTKSSACRLLSAAAALLMLGACQTTGNSCDGWRPIRPTRSEIARMSDDQVKQVLAHNEHGRRRCGWR